MHCLESSCLALLSLRLAKPAIVARAGHPHNLQITTAMHALRMACRVACSAQRKPIGKGSFQSLRMTEKSVLQSLLQEGKGTMAGLRLRS